MTAELHCYDYVNQPYEIVRRAVLADPQLLFRHATSEGTASKLHVKVGAIDLGAEIEIEMKSVEERREAFERPSTILELTWHSRRRAGLFPVMTAKLVLYPLTGTETQLELTGAYDPPLGVVGEAVDAVAFGRFAQESVTTFLREIATYLRRNLAADQAMA